MDCWNPETFDNELRDFFIHYSDLIATYFCEEKRLMDEHLNSDPYESLKSNQYSSAYNDLLENMLTPMFVDRFIRVWHYTRLLDDEVSSIQQRITPSTLDSLNQRLDALVKKQLLTRDEADTIFQESPFQSQEEIRAGRFWSVTVPVSPEHGGVKPFLESWGGESAYFWLSDKVITQKLKSIGLPRILEIETRLRDNLNAYCVAKTASMSWAVNLGEAVSIESADLAITNCLDTTSVLKIHTIGDEIYSKVAKTYPSGCSNLLEV